MKEKAAKAFAKYHEKFLERMDNPRTRVGMLVAMMLARVPPEIKKEREEMKKGLEGLDERIGRMKREGVRPAGITQDARGWYNECGRPRYPILTGRGAVMMFDAQNQKRREGLQG